MKVKFELDESEVRYIVQLLHVMAEMQRTMAGAGSWKVIDEMAEHIGKSLEANASATNRD
jgi:hypothetical protein